MESHKHICVDHYGFVCWFCWMCQ